MSHPPISRQFSTDSIKFSKKKAHDHTDDLSTFWKGINAYSITLKNTSKFFSNTNKKKYDSLFLSHKFKKKYLKSKYIIDPTNPAKIIWDVFIILLVFYSVILIPFRIGFNVELNPIINAFDSIYIPIFFAFDIFLSFNTAYVDRTVDQLVESRLYIARKYVRGWFIIDLLATIPFDVISGLSAIRIIRLFRLNKMSHSFSQLRKLWTRELDTEESSNRSFSRSWLDYGVIDIIFIIFQFLFILHILSCMWNFLTLPASMGNPEYNWKTVFGFEHASITSLYVAAFYYNIITLLTIGYGDIYPVNNTERFYAVCIMIGGVMFFSIMISIIENMMLRSNPRKYAYNAKMTEFKNFLLDTNVPNSVKDQARRAYGFYLNNRSSFNEDDIFKDLIPELKTEFIYNIYYSDIQKINIFRDVPLESSKQIEVSEERPQKDSGNSHKVTYHPVTTRDSMSPLVTQRGFIAHLFTHARPFEFFHDQVIIKQGDVCKDLIFIIRGKLVMINKFNKNNLITGFITEGNYLGDLEFYNNCVALSTYKAIRPGIAISVSFRDLKEALTLFPKCATEFQQLMTDRGRNLDIVLREFTKKFSYNYPGSPDGLSMKKKNSFLLSSINIFKNSNDEYDGNFDSEKTDYIRVGERNSSFFFNHKKFSQIFYKSSYIWLDGVLESDPKKIIEKYLILKTNNNPFSDQLARIIIFTPAHYEQHWSIYNSEDKLEEGSIIEVPISYFFNKFILFPEGTIKYLWDLLVAMIILYCALIIPLEVAFNQFVYKGSLLFTYATSVIFGIDVILSFRTAFYSPPFDAYIISGDIIAWKYFKSWFIPDVISALPINLIVEYICEAAGSPISSYSSRWLRLFRLLRITKLSPFFAHSHIIDNIQERSGISPFFYSLLFVLMKLGLILHFLTCFWWGITSTIPGDNFNEILISDELRGTNSTLGTKYLTVIYYIMTTISTTGYGDISPQTTTDRCICIILAMIGATIFGFIIANMKTIFLDYSLSTKVANDRLSLIHQYLTEKNTSQQFAETFMVHFERKYKALKLYDVDEMVNKLPPRLGSKLLYSFYSSKIELIPIFKYIPNYTVALYIFQFLKPVYCDEGHIITKEGDPAENIFFITSGSARCFKRYKKKKNLTRQEINRKMQRSLRYKSSTLFGAPSSVLGTSFSASSTIFEESSHSDTPSAPITRTNSLQSTEDTKERIGILSNLPHLDLDSLRILSHYDDCSPATSPSRPDFNSPPDVIQLRSGPRITESLNIPPSLTSEDKPTPFVRPALKKRVSSMNFDISDTKPAKSKISKSDTLYNFSKVEKNFKRYSPNQLIKFGFELVIDLIQGDFMGYMGLLNAHKRKLTSTYTPFSSKYPESTKCSMGSTTQFNLGDMDGLTHEYSVCATQPCTLYTLSIKDIQTIITENKSIAIELQSAFTKAIVAQHKELKFRSRKTSNNKFIQILRRNFNSSTDSQTLNLDDDESIDSKANSMKSNTSNKIIENSYKSIIIQNKKKLVNHFLNHNDLIFDSDSDDDPFIGYMKIEKKYNDDLPILNLEPSFSTDNIYRQPSNSSIKSKSSMTQKNSMTSKMSKFNQIKISREEIIRMRKQKLKAMKKRKQKQFHNQLTHYQIMNAKFSQLIHKTSRVSSINFHIESLNNILNYHNDLIQYFNDYLRFNKELFLETSGRSVDEQPFVPIEEYTLISFVNSKHPTLEYDKISSVFHSLMNTTNSIVESIPEFETFELFIKGIMEPLDDITGTSITSRQVSSNVPNLSLTYFNDLVQKTDYIRESIAILCDYINIVNYNIEKDLPLETNIITLPTETQSDRNLPSQPSRLKLQKIRFMNYFDLYKYKMAFRSYLNPITSPVPRTNKSSVDSNISVYSKDSTNVIHPSSFHLSSFLKKTYKSLSKMYSTSTKNMETLVKFFITPTQVLKKYYQPTFLRRSLSFSIIDSNISTLIYEKATDDFKFFQNRKRAYSWPSTDFNDFTT